MLPARHRMRRSEDFSATLRGGVRGGARRVVVHMDLTEGTPLVGFVVSKAVGNSVVRHRVVRKLRHIARDVLLGERTGRIVVRALPAAANASSDELREDVVEATGRAERKAVSR